MSVFISLLFTSLLNMGALALATLGIALIFKTSFTTNFAQGSIAVVGGYVAVFVCGKLGWNVWASIPFAVIASFLLAFVVDKILFQRGRHVNALGKQIITMGLVVLITGLIPIIFWAVPVGADFKFFNERWKFNLFGAELVLSANYLFCFFIAAVIIALILILLKFSKWGISVRATASNEAVAQMMGINTKSVTAVTWGIAGALGALAAIMLLGTTSESAAMMVGTQVDAFMAGILGGMDTFAGPVVGAAILPFLRSLLTYWISGWADFTLYGIILIVVLIKPTGLLGRKTVVKV